MQVFFKSHGAQAADLLELSQRRTRFVLRLVKRDVDSRRLRQRAIKSELTNAHHSSAPHPATPTRIMSDS